jgi:hypothetical protein
VRLYFEESHTSTRSSPGYNPFETRPRIRLGEPLNPIFTSQDHQRYDGTGTSNRRRPRLPLRSTVSTRMPSSAVQLDSAEGEGFEPSERLVERSTVFKTPDHMHLDLRRCSRSPVSDHHLTTEGWRRPWTVVDGWTLQGRSGRSRGATTSGRLSMSTGSSRPGTRRHGGSSVGPVG